MSKMIKLCKVNRFRILQYSTRSFASNPKESHEKINFDSISTAYGYKSKRELFRGWFVFKLCSYSLLVNYLSEVSRNKNLFRFISYLNI